MGIADLKNKLKKYIDTGEEKMLKLMYAVAKEYNGDDEIYQLTPEQLDEMETRRQKRISGESKGYSWNQTKKMITGNN